MQVYFEFGSNLEICSNGFIPNGRWQVGSNIQKFVNPRDDVSSTDMQCPELLLSDYFRCRYLKSQ